MFVKRKVNILFFNDWFKKEIFLYFLWSSFVVVINLIGDDILFFSLPWLPISVIGTAVAIYLGFKNNQSYDRTWEARKIWGAIVNDSRSFSVLLRDFLSSNGNVDKENFRQIVHRHISWLYQLSFQLRQAKEWEHDKKREKKLRAKLVKDFALPINTDFLKNYLSPEEFESVNRKKNIATHLIANNSKDLSTLKNEQSISDYQFVELSKYISAFYDHQRMCERIKNFPLPRQFSSFSNYFVIFFLILVPLGLIDAISQMNDIYHLLTVIPMAMIIFWVYWFMEKIGDYAENPFEGLLHDIPMVQISRAIEIDLLEIIDEKNIPEPIQAVDDNLM